MTGGWPVGFDIVGSRSDTPHVDADVSFSPSPFLWVLLAAVVLGAVAAWLWVRRSREARGPSARPAVFSLLGDVTEGSIPVGWTDEQIVVLIGDVRLDLRKRPPGDGAVLRVFHLVGDVRLDVSPGTQVTTGGTTLLGDQRVDVEAGEGPELEVRAWGLFGDVKVSDKLSE
jgi:predicted membrane protein